MTAAASCIQGTLNAFASSRHFASSSVRPPDVIGSRQTRKNECSLSSAFEAASRARATKVRRLIDVLGGIRCRTAGGPPLAFGPDRVHRVRPSRRIRRVSRSQGAVGRLTGSGAEREQYVARTPQRQASVHAAEMRTLRSLYRLLLAEQSASAWPTSPELVVISPLKDD